MRKTQDALHLECILTDQEKLAYSKTLSENVSKTARAEEALSSFQKQMKAEIASCEAQINMLAEKINTGKEYRMVECEIRYDFKMQEKKWIRSDTGEVAKQDIISEEELQEEMKLGAA
ncbi:MAG: hypothetical protein JXA50_01620 [Deltaproteobacteria bacterium]|nr:hypothetical protein [Deltaproteobacteria bacterium]